MAILTEDMKRVVREQQLGYVVTVCSDGTPNLSPKGTTRVWDDDHLVFADIRSPRTIANLKHNPAIEINVVDWFTRKGYRFKGIATVIEAGSLFDELVAFYNQPKPADAPRRIQAIVMVEVQMMAVPTLEICIAMAQARPRSGLLDQSAPVMRRADGGPGDCSAGAV